LELLLNAQKALGRDLRAVCGWFFEIPIIVTEEGITNEEEITGLFYGHCYLRILLNYFAEVSREECYRHLDHLLDIQDKLVDALRRTSKYEHPLYGDMFKSYSTFIKRLKDDPRDSSLAFSEKYRTSFVAPTPELFTLLTSLRCPIREDRSRVIWQLMMDYQYVLRPNQSEFWPCSSFRSEEVIHFLAVDLLPFALRVKWYAIAETIIGIMGKQINLSEYKDKARFRNLITNISGVQDRLKCFHAYSQYWEWEGLPRSLQIKLLYFLKTLLDSGPPQKYDVLGKEWKFMSESVDALLCSEPPITQRNCLKSLLGLLFFYQTDLIELITRFVKSSILNINNNGGGRYEKMPSLTPETFDLFFGECLRGLNRKVTEIKKKVVEPRKKNNSSGITLNEETVKAFMNRLNKCVGLMHSLLRLVVPEEVESKTLRHILKEGKTWATLCYELIPFFQDAQEVDAKSVQDFYQTLASDVVERLRAFGSCARNREEGLQVLLPAFRKALTQLTVGMGRRNPSFRIVEHSTQG
jgi:hypothetical protein